MIEQLSSRFLQVDRFRIDAYNLMSYSCWLPLHQPKGMGHAAAGIVQGQIYRWLLQKPQREFESDTMNAQEKTLRPSSRYWVQEIGAIVLVLIIFPVAGILYFGEGMYFAGGLALIVGISYLVSELGKARSSQITFSEAELVARIGRQEFRQPWETIQAVKFDGQGQSRSLLLFCEEHSINIPCRFYDETKLTGCLKERLSPNVLHPQAYQRLPRFLEWQEEVAKKLSALHRPLRVSLGGFEKWVGIFCAGLGILFAGLYYFSKVEAMPAILMGGLFGGLGLLLLVHCIGWMEADDRQISVRSLFRKNTFVWSDLREIFFNSRQNVLALVGDNSRLIVPKFSSCSGKDRKLLNELISYKIEMSKIEPVESIKPLFWFSKNA